jgi:hypothetical protein
MLPSRRPTVIEVRVIELRQLFNAIDPSLFWKRDQDPKGRGIHCRVGFQLFIERDSNDWQIAKPNRDATLAHPSDRSKGETQFRMM